MRRSSSYAGRGRRLRPAKLQRNEAGSKILPEAALRSIGVAWVNSLILTDWPS